MAKLFRAGRVVVVLAGKHAGKKAVVVSSHDNNSRNKRFGHAVVLGVSKSPMKVTKRMSKKKLDKRTEVTTFIKTLNYRHLMPTRYVTNTEFEPKDLVPESALADPEARNETRKSMSKMLKEKFVSPVDGKISKDMGFLKKKLRF